MATINFRAHGPYEVHRKGSRNGRIIDVAAARILWESTATLQRLALAKGCYVFATRHQGGGVVPWYVGQTAVGFAKECFNPANHLRINDALFAESGQLVLLLVEYLTTRGAINRTAITELENRLIGLAYKRNPRLINIHGTRVQPPRVLAIIGAMNSTARPSRSAVTLKKALGMP
jgi:hypothetical protein